MDVADEEVQVIYSSQGWWFNSFIALQALISDLCTTYQICTKFVFCIYLYSQILKEHKYCI